MVVVALLRGRVRWPGAPAAMHGAGTRPSAPGRAPRRSARPRLSLPRGTRRLRPRRGPPNLASPAAAPDSPRLDGRAGPPLPPCPPVPLQRAVLLAGVDDRRSWAALARRCEGLGYADAHGVGPPRRAGRPGAGARWPPPTPPPPCASAPWCSATTTAIPWCWPRRRPPSTCSPAAASSSGSGAGWLTADYERAGITLDPARGAHRPAGRGHRRDQGPLRRRTLHVRGRPTTGWTAWPARRPRCSGPARRCSSVAAAGACWAWRRARPTSWA